ncbi:hypothetical protein WISP_00561 [Willisornis vidua]|uniref:Uncharacterized protein n=1 Tax=Willisornis vidua TaxID=1566151 RepID=A0ABQ9DZS2_9PASS|nr:hypothetical protein WISP_00561 [Willisornis vidua]
MNSSWSSLAAQLKGRYLSLGTEVLESIAESRTAAKHPSEKEKKTSKAPLREEENNREEEESSKIPLREDKSSKKEERAAKKPGVVNWTFVKMVNYSMDN